jgi:hypothetical protein
VGALAFRRSKIYFRTRNQHINIVLFTTAGALGVAAAATRQAGAPFVRHGTVRCRFRPSSSRL